MRRWSTIVAAGVAVAVLGGCQARGAARSRPTQEAARDDARIELTAVGSDSWRLVAWSASEPAAPTPALSLRYAAGSFSGRSGCNRYTAPVEQRPGRTVAVGAMAVTRMMCPPPIDAVERRFLGALGRARAIERRADELGIVTTDDDGRAVTLRFRAESHPTD